MDYSYSSHPSHYYYRLPLDRQYSLLRRGRDGPICGLYSASINILAEAKD